MLFSRRSAGSPKGGGTRWPSNLFCDQKENKRGADGSGKNRDDVKTLASVGWGARRTRGELTLLLSDRGGGKGKCGAACKEHRKIKLKLQFKKASKGDEEDPHAFRHRHNPDARRKKGGGQKKVPGRPEDRSDGSSHAQEIFLLQAAELFVTKEKKKEHRNAPGKVPFLQEGAK